MNEIVSFLITSFIMFWLGFYYGTYYGEDFYRCCRYWRLRLIRWKQGRHKYNNKIILGK